MQQQFFFFVAAGNFLIKIVSATSVGPENDPAAISGPHWPPLVMRIEGKACERAARQVQQPDVALTRGFGIQDQSFSIRREGRVPIGTGNTRRAERLARSIEPRQLREYSTFNRSFRSVESTDPTKSP